MRSGRQHSNNKTPPRFITQLRQPTQQEQPSFIQKWPTNTSIYQHLDTSTHQRIDTQHITIAPTSPTIEDLTHLEAAFLNKVARHALSQVKRKVTDLPNQLQRPTNTLPYSRRAALIFPKVAGHALSSQTQSNRSKKHNLENQKPLRFTIQLQQPANTPLESSSYSPPISKCSRTRPLQVKHKTANKHPKKTPTYH